MHGQGYRSNNTDPTNPTFLGALPQGVGTGHGRGAAIGRTEYDPSFQRPFPYVPQNGGNQFAAAGFPSNAPKARMGGLIGEMPLGGREPPPARNFQFSQPGNFGEVSPYHNSGAYSAEQQSQMVAKLRIGGGDAASARNSNQLAFYRGQAPVYSKGMPLGQRPSHPGSEPRLSAPSISSSQYPSSYQKAPEPLGQAQSRGGSIGQTSTPGGQPLVGRMPSGNASIASAQAGSYTSQQIPSPFVPASTSQPIVGGAASQYSVPLAPGRHRHAGSSLEDGQRNPSFSTEGGFSHLGSVSNLGTISQLGSMSQMGSIGTPSRHQSNTASGGVNKSRSINSLPTKVKAVCSSGGHFVRLAGGGFEYQGGETRLISVPNFCLYQDLLESLERLAGSAAGSHSGSSASSPSLKYQLPSEPNVYVDLVDDEDTQLMFDDWHDYSSANKNASKLHFFVDWRRDPLQNSNDVKAGNLGTTESVESIEAAGQRSPGKMDSADAVGNSAGSAQRSSSAEGPARASSDHQSPIDYDLIAGRMEVIQAKDVSLVKYLGSGGYGEVYLGKWHSSEAAIKCLNPSLFFNGGQVSQAAITELIREANLLGCLRHPNVVWVYGVVLPNPKGDETSSDEGSDDSSDPSRLAASAAQQQGKGNVPGTVRPPAIVTEFMSQGSLKGALQRKADIVQGALMRVLIAMDAAKGMDYLHQKNIVHFDLKSANLLLGWKDRRAVCKVADFGLSKQKRETYVSNVSSQRGTLPWIAPEIIKSPHAVTEKVDVFSFGVVMWELWTGKEPYDGLNYHALLHQITTSDTSLRPALPGSPDWDPSIGPEPVPGYRALMERCWQESPAGRPNFSQIVKALKDMATALRPKKPRSSASGSMPSGRTSRGPSQALPHASTPAALAQTPTAGAAPPQPSREQAGAGTAPAATEIPESKPREKEGESPRGAIQNPFAAQSQKPILKDDSAKEATEAFSKADKTDIGNSLASTEKPGTLMDPFRAFSQSPAAGAVEKAKKAGLEEALSLGTAIGSEETSHGGASVQPESDKDARTAEAKTQEKAIEEGKSPRHQPAVSAFTAAAKQTEM